jgi:hypothetical protein
MPTVFNHIFTVLLCVIHWVIVNLLVYNSSKIYMQFMVRCGLISVGKFSAICLLIDRPYRYVSDSIPC